MKIFYVNFFVVCILLFPPVVESTIHVIDARNREVIIQQPATRIITLAPHLAEMLFELGAGSRIVGTVEPRDFPLEAKKIPSVGHNKNLNLEMIIALKPDLVIAWSSGGYETALKKLEALNYPIFFSEAKELLDIATQYELVSQLVGKTTQGKLLADNWRQEIAHLQKKYMTQKLIKVFYQIWPEPLYSVNDEHFIGQIIQLCGGENILADSPIAVPQIAVETVLVKDPDVIIFGMDGQNSEIGKQHTVLWEKFSAMSAVKHQKILPISATLISRPGPRLLTGAKAFCELLEKVRN